MLHHLCHYGLCVHLNVMDASPLVCVKQVHGAYAAQLACGTGEVSMKGYGSAWRPTWQPASRK